MAFDLSILIATVNGSGSQSANLVLAKSLFRQGTPVATKNIFPSNIAGLPTWFSLRLNERGYSAWRLKHDVVVARNAQTFADDLQVLADGGLFIYDRDLKISADALARLDEIASQKRASLGAISFREWVDKATTSVPLRKVLGNMIYVGVLAELLKIEDATVTKAVHDQFEGKASVVDTNCKAIALGREAGRAAFANVDKRWGRLSVPVSKTARDMIFVDGNSAAAMGAVVGGCTVLSWYPITPATSLAETFTELSKMAASVQTEDELSAICMAVGAGWAGARAMTATSGPGLSLMAEAAGLSYFAEVPAVIWDVQRAGPSTGLPTRTSQGDVLTASTFSHGDTEPVVLIPATPHECFEFAELAFDLAEILQTLVIVLSDLDLGMNYFIDREFKLPTKSYRRGKILTKADLDRGVEFARYRDVDNDGIAYRTLPGTPDPRAAYFTRGSGHNESAKYSERGEDYKNLLDRLKRKIEMNLNLLPAPEITSSNGTGANKSERADIGLISYGSSSQAIDEIRDELEADGLTTRGLRIRSLPLAPEIGPFLASCSKIVIVEQNRDGQMRRLLTQKFPEHAAQFSSALQYDGMPITTEIILPQILRAHAEAQA